jgi:ribosome-associated heat shock protein Hsp15
MPTAEVTKVRIDKWLWAARFYKTRSLAKQAIDGGKVHCDGCRVKASKDITLGLMLSIRQELEVREVQVLALSEQRRGAPEAALLYAETEASIALREQHKRERQAGNIAISEHRPNKKERRQIHRFVRVNQHGGES